MTMNPNGAVPVFDGATPRILTFYAMAATSGGQFVFASGAAAVVSSGADSFAATDLTASTGASGGQFTGIALGGVTASGSPIAVATRGCFIVAANGTVLAGANVCCDSYDAVATVGSATMTDYYHGRKIGRAITSASSGGFCIVDIQG